MYLSVAFEMDFFKERNTIQIMNGYECNGTDIFMR